MSKKRKTQVWKRLTNAELQEKARDRASWLVQEHECSDAFMRQMRRDLIIEAHFMLNEEGTRLEGILRMQITYGSSCLEDDENWK